jgi:ribosome-associated protein
VSEAQTFSLNGKDHIKLCDLLSVTGLCDSAGSAKHVIDSGVVKVDGEVELRKRAKIISGKTIEYQGQKINVI